MRQNHHDKPRTQCVRAAVKALLACIVMLSAAYLVLTSTLMVSVATAAERNGKPALTTTARRDTLVRTAASSPPIPRPSPASKRRMRLEAVANWRYQLLRIDAAEVARADVDLVVIDYAPDRVYSIELPFSRADVAQMRKRPGGSDKILLAYLSIGEAERYRSYWNNAWYDPVTRPPWLLDANKEWEGNFPVRFWYEQWQAIVFGSPEAYLDRILAAGFDGVYLDRADVFQELEAENPDAEEQMADFIVRMAVHARQLKPDALIVMQNAEELVRRAPVRQALDGIAKEDLFYGINHDESPNEPGMVRDTLAELEVAKSNGLKVFVVEYLSTAAAAARATKQIAALGFLPLVAERSLGTFAFEPSPTTDAVNGGTPQGNAQPASPIDEPPLP